MNVNDVHPGESYQIVINSNASTGYQWTYKILGDPNVVSITSRYVGPSEPIPGKGGQQVFTMNIVGEGDTSVLFFYSRPWEKLPRSPSRTYNISSRY